MGVLIIAILVRSVTTDITLYFNPDAGMFLKDLSQFLQFEITLWQREMPVSIKSYLLQQDIFPSGKMGCVTKGGFQVRNGCRRGYADKYNLYPAVKAALLISAIIIQRLAFTKIIEIPEGAVG